MVVFEGIEIKSTDDMLALWSRLQGQEKKRKPPPILFDQEDVCFVASLFWKLDAENVQSQYGPIRIPGNDRHPRDLQPIMLPIYGCYLERDKGDDKCEYQYDSARARAEGIASRLGHFGVFVPANGISAIKEESEAALKKLEAYYLSQVEVAEDAWARTGNPRHINRHARVAVEYFGMEKPWAYNVADRMQCPGCGTSIPRRTVRCPQATCGAVIDWERARELGMLSEHQEERGVQLGKLRPLAAANVKPAVAARVAQ